MAQGEGLKDVGWGFLHQKKLKDHYIIKLRLVKLLYSTDSKHKYIFKKIVYLATHIAIEKKIPIHAAFNVIDVKRSI